MKALAVMTGAEVAWPEYIETPDPSKEFEQGTLILFLIFISFSIVTLVFLRLSIFLRSFL